MIINPQYTNPILNWVLNKNNRDNYFHTPGPNVGGNTVGRTHLHLSPLPLLNANFPFQELQNIHQIILKHYDLPLNLPFEPHLGVMISYSEEGHKVQEHSDPNYKDKFHTRFNILISKPFKGGEPIINNKIINVRENEVWVCVAGKYKHSTVLTEGIKPRIIISYGHFLKENQLKNLNIL